MLLWCNVMQPHELKERERKLEAIYAWMRMWGTYVCVYVFMRKEVCVYVYMIIRVFMYTCECKRVYMNVCVRIYAIWMDYTYDCVNFYAHSCHILYVIRLNKVCISMGPSVTRTSLGTPYSKPSGFCNQKEAWLVIDLSWIMGSW